MQNDSLRPFFEPQGVVLVGATRTPGFGYGIPLVLQRQGWADRVSLVNPAGGTLHGMPLYPELSDVPDPVDLAVILMPARLVPDALRQVGARGIRHAVIESAGFAEIGSEGADLQRAALQAAQEAGVRVIGPNCVGVVNTANAFTTVEVVPEALHPGPVAIIAQSGVFGNILLDDLPERGVFISKAVTLGNRLDVNECDVLEYLHADPDSRVIMMYLEGAADGRRLVATLKKVCRDKPVLILKGGRTAVGRAATASHTASLSGEDALYDAAFKEAGAIRAESLDELIDLVRVFASQPLPAGNRLSILTGSGSLGVLASDRAASLGLELPDLAAATVARVKEGAPAWMNVRNPLDTGPSGLFGTALAALMDDDATDMVLPIVVLPYAVFSYFESLGLTAAMYFGDIAAVRRLRPDKPLVACVVGNDRFAASVGAISGEETPIFRSPEPAARALAALASYADWRKSAT